jgi:predicted ATPase
MIPQIRHKLARLMPWGHNKSGGLESVRPQAGKPCQRSKDSMLRYALEELKLLRDYR